MAGRGADASGRKPVRRKRAKAREEKSSVARPEVTVPGTEKPRVERREATRADRKARAPSMRRGTNAGAFRRSTPSHFLRGRTFDPHRSGEGFAKPGAVR